MRIVCDARDTNVCMYVCMLRVRLGLVLGRHPKINLFGLHYCVICCEVETKYEIGRHIYISAAAWARRTEHLSFPLYKQGTDARRLHYFLGIAVLEQGIEMCWIFLESLVECQ